MKKLLFICGSLPYPIVSGGRKREFQLITDLSKIFDVELLCVTRDLVSDNKNSKYLSEYAKKIKLFFANQSSDCILSERVIIENLLRRFNTKEVSGWLSKNIERFDVFHTERSVIIPDTILTTSIPLVVSEQSIESGIVYQVFISTKSNFEDSSIIEKYYKRLVRHENLVWGKAKRIVTITKQDAEQIEKRIRDPNKIFVIPPKFNNEKVTNFSKSRNSKINLIYLGNFNYFPNVVSVDRIFREIMPLLDKMKVNYNFRVVGNGVNKIKNGLENSHCQIIDFTEDLEDQWKWADLALLPIYFGGGLKTKILDSLDNRVPVITTTLGLNGFEHYENVFVYPNDSSAGIARLIKSFAEKPDLLSEITDNLRKEKFHWNIPKNIFSSTLLLYDGL